jgi:hypothetical protein
MSLFRSCLGSCLGLGLVFVIAGCGGNSGSVQLAGNAAGTFTAASLKGQYAYEVSGQLTTGQFTIAGSVVADGNGNITSGVQDENSPSGVVPNLGVSGTYTITADGRGTMLLNSSVGQFQYDFVITSPQRVLITRFEGGATASGTMELQDPTAFSNAAISGPYAFTAAGVDGNGNALESGGVLTADGVSAANGVLDFNDSGTVTAQQSATGTFAVASNGRGTLSVTAQGATLNFVTYVVSRQHFKLIESDAGVSQVGDAFSQTAGLTNASVSGPFVFAVAGGSSAPLVIGGSFNADGNGTLNGGSEDVNSGGSISQNAPATGTYSIATNGRGTLALTEEGITDNYFVYPSSGGLLMIASDTNTTSGTALAASATPALQGNVGLNLSAANLTLGETDSIAQFNATGGSLTGAHDVTQFGSLASNLKLTGTYSLSGLRGTMQLKSSAGTLNTAFYPAANGRYLLLELDGGQVGIGEMDAQQ